jgi:hypothetical protein
MGWRGTLFEKLGRVALANSAAIVACLIFLLSLRGGLGNLQLVMVYFFCALPFLFSGIVVSLTIAETLERVDRVYFFDLMGAAGGCALLVPLLNWLAVIVTAALFAVSAAIWFKLAKAGWGRIAAVSVALVLVGFIVYNSKYYAVLDVRYAKNQELKDEEFVKWNSFSRIALKPEPGSGMKSIVIDADAATGVPRFDFDHLTADQLLDLRFHGPGFPYLLRPGAKALIIGPGGGWDVARALAAGSKDITGVEINPIIATTIMRQRYPQYSNGLYFRPEVHIVVEDGRSFVRRSHEHYQVLQATLVDTWASTAAGAFALSENNLYTTNAFRDYLSHLTPDGVMAFTRWGFVPPRESLRVVALAREALIQLGEAEPARNVMVVRENVDLIAAWGAKDTILVSREPFSAADIATVAASLGPGHMQAVYLPGTQNATPFRDLLLTSRPEAFFDSYPFDVRPVTDDQPFFFYTTQSRDVWRYLGSASHDSADFKINRALPLLFGLVGVSIIATIVILSLPPLVLGKRLPRQPGAVGALLYFLAIGAGYILIQVALIQKFVLFLGHPTYALTVIIFSMLVFSGLGSYFSQRFIAGDWTRLCMALVLIAVLVGILSTVVTSVTEGGVGLPFLVKVLISVLLIAAPAFVMGMPFPTALNRVEAVMPACVRWAWAINAAASVLGSAAAVFLAIYLGLRTTLLIGGLLYLGAWLSARLSPLAGKSAKELANAR